MKGVMCDGWWVSRKVLRCETKDNVNLIVLFLRPPTTLSRFPRSSRRARGLVGAVGSAVVIAVVSRVSAVWETMSTTRPQAVRMLWGGFFDAPRVGRPGPPRRGAAAHSRPLPVPVGARGW